MSVKPEHQRPGQVFARRVKEERQRFGWTQQQLVDRLKGLGYPISRPTLIRIEAGGTRAEKAPLAEVFALACALSVKPTDLMAPLNNEAAMALTPNLIFGAPLAREWLRGDLVLPMTWGEDIEQISDARLRQLLEHEITRNMSPAAIERWRSDGALAQAVDNSVGFIRDPEGFTRILDKYLRPGSEPWFDGPEEEKPMATVVERFTGKGERRLFVVFHATDRQTGAKRKVWELQTSSLKKAANSRKAAVEVALRASGGLWPPEAPKAQPITFAEYRDLWLRDRARKVSERMFENDRRSFRLYLDRFDEMPLEVIRRTDVKALVGELVDAGKGRNTIRNIVAPLRSMLREAVRDELITANPAADIEIPESAPLRPASVPTRAELDRIITAARSDDTRDAIVAMAALGLRRGECFALRWADVDFAGSLVHVRATNHRGRIADRTKTKAGIRLVPLFPSARATLDARRRRLPVDPHPTAFVFANAIGGAMDPGNWARREWKPALRKAGLEKKFHVHELRHFAATALDEQGMVGKLRTEIIGHADEEITNSIYTHIRRERVAAVAAEYDPLGPEHPGLGVANPHG